MVCPAKAPGPPHGSQRADGNVEVEMDLEDHADLLFRLSGGACGSVTVFPASPGIPITSTCRSTAPKAALIGAKKRLIVNKRRILTPSSCSLSL
jgi:hypothetical protein